MQNNFSDRLVTARVKAGISQSELAAIVGIAPAQISRYEQGKNTPRPHILGKLANGLQVRQRWLEHGEEPATFHPERSRVVTLQFTDEQYKLLESAAEKMGLPVEEAARKMLKEHAANHINEQLGGEYLTPAEDDSLFAIKASVADLEKKVAELLRNRS